MPFDFTPLPELPDVILIEPKAFGDERGWFMETFKDSEFARYGIEYSFPQDNHSRSTARGIIRGLHYQKDPAAQGKLVRSVVGTFLDIAVDIRRGSPTWGRWIGVELSAENRRLLWVPPGFAHGFCTLTDVCEVLYKATHEYSPTHDRQIRWNDPAIGVRWPVGDPILSPKDAHAPTLAESDNNFTWTAR